MTSHEREREAEPETADGDVTMPAGDDVVAQIRAHAAKIRSGAVAPDAVDVGPLKIWTPDDEADAIVDEIVDEIGDEIGEDDTALIVLPPAEPASPPELPQRRQLLPHDDTVAFTASSPVPQAPTAPAQAKSLIEGVEPPESSIAFWADRPFRASGVDAPSRLHRTRTVPLWVWIALVTVLIVVGSVGIAVVVASTGPPT